MFASAKERVGTDRVTLDLDECWTDRQSLMQYICLKSLTGLSELLPILMLAINEEYVTDSQSNIRLKNNDVLALIPPITGG